MSAPSAVYHSGNHQSSDYYKCVVEFTEWLCVDVLRQVPDRRFVFSIPKMLRRYFLSLLQKHETSKALLMNVNPHLNFKLKVVDK